MANSNTRSSLSKGLTFIDLSHIPGPRGQDYIIKYNKLFKKDILETFVKIHSEYGDIASFPWPMNSVLIYSPELVKKVLIEDGKKYIKGEQTEELRAVLGEGLVTNNDHKSWLKSRSLISKEFGPRAVLKFSDQFHEICQEHINQWNDESFDICESMKFLTFKIACQTFLKSNLGIEDSKKVNEAVHYTSLVMYKRIFEFFPLPYFLPTRKNRLFNQHYETLNGIVMDLIREEKKSGDKANPKSVLEKLVHAVDEETGTGLSDEELRDEILTMLLAGHESSAHTLTWVLGLLARHQEIQEGLFQEMKHTDGPDAVPYLNKVLQESMRLYPSFPVIARKAAEDTVLGPYKIPKNTNVVIPIYVIHRTSQFWKDPLVFNPNRVDEVDFEMSFSYLPFSRGMRKCVGEVFAMAEISIVVFHIIKNFKLKLVDQELPQEEASITLKPRGGLKVSVSRRL